MSAKPAIVFILSDFPVHISEGTCGGGEVATVSLAKAFSQLGFRTIVFGNIPAGNAEVSGIEFINYGDNYNMPYVLEKLKNVGPYYAYGATLVHPFLHLQSDPNCLSKIVINHSPKVNASGLEPSTVLNIVDYQVSVSEAQRLLMLGRGEVSIDKLPVITHGFDPEIFKYSGPENRDFNHIVFTGRLEHAKGIEILITSYTGLKQEFPKLKVSIYGSGTAWPEITEIVNQISQKDPDFKYYGTVPQSEISKALATAGLLVFPSVSFESAGLAVLDAQASGCPVLANAIGGVPEYVSDAETGVLVRQKNPNLFKNELRRLLLNQDLLRQMSINCKAVARKRTWKDVASDLINLSSKSTEINTRNNVNPLEVVFNNPVLKRGWNTMGASLKSVMEDHEDIIAGRIGSDSFFDELLSQAPEIGIFHFWKALRYEGQLNKGEALNSLTKAVKLTNGMDWQSLYWMTILKSEAGDISSAGKYAFDIISLQPDFPMRAMLEQIIDASGIVENYQLG